MSYYRSVTKYNSRGVSYIGTESSPVYVSDRNIEAEAKLIGYIWNGISWLVKSACCCDGEEEEVEVEEVKEEETPSILNYIYEWIISLIAIIWKILSRVLPTIDN